MKSGVYQIFNTLTDDCYIGSSRNIIRRWKGHLYLLRKNNNCCKILQNAFNKYGENAFELNILAYTSEENLFELEQFIVDILQPKYNILTKDVRVPTSGKSRYNDKSLYKKYAEERLKNGNGFGQKPKIVEVYYNNEFIKECDSISDCAKYVNKSIAFVSKAIKNKRIFEGYYLSLKV